MSWFQKWKRKRIFNFIKEKLHNLLSGFYKCQAISPNSSKEELYLCALLSSGVDAEAAAIILETSSENAKKHGESLNLRTVAQTLILFGMPAEYDSTVKQNTESAFVWGETPRPKLEKTFTSYYEIIVDIIPDNI